MKINAPTSDPKTPQEQPETARETIRAAVEEHKAAAVDEGSKLKAEEERKEPVKVDPPKEPDKKEEKKEDKVTPEKVDPPADEKKPVDEKAEEKKDDKPEEGKGKEAKASKPAPFGLPKDIRAEWDSLSPKTQDYLAKTVKENLDTKANQGRKSYLNDVDQVLTPYIPELQKLGASPAQLVKRLLDYSDALAGEKTKYLAIAKLAEDFRIDLSMFGKPQQQQDKDSKVPPAEVYEDYIPPELNSKLDTILNKFEQMAGTQRSENDKAAEQSLNQWAGFDPATNEYKTKPFFQHVRQTMYSLIQNGTIPLVNGKIDLDGAYDAACYMHPDIREYILEEQANVLKSKELEKQKQQAATIARAKNAASSIRPGAPAPRLPVQTKNQNGQQMSVRDSLKAALAEARDARI